MIKKLIESKPHQANILNCIEELSELVQAVSKHERYRLLGKISELPKLRQSVLEEVVDAKISIDIIIELFNIQGFEYTVEEKKKMKRNIERIE